METNLDGWRLWLSPPASGTENMAWDETLFQLYKTGVTQRPLLRFYTWAPAALSLGRFQKSNIGLKIQTLNTIPIARRMTGGGAIWHDQELTYSLMCRQEDLKTLTVKESFEKLCNFLLSTWRDLGYSSEFAKDSELSLANLGTPSVACFAGQEEYDILVQGKKLGGNAQRRSSGYIFQHGSIPFKIDWLKLKEIFEPVTLPQKDYVTCLEDLDSDNTIAKILPLLINNFSRTLGVKLTDWTPAELEQKYFAENLLKNNNPQWIFDQ